MTIFEFLIPRRPLSLQAKRPRLREWKEYVTAQARTYWSQPALPSDDLHLTLVYLCDEAPPDVDNIIKPIQDALVGLVFADDAQIAEVESHRRFLQETFDLTRLPIPLLEGIANQRECVYVRVSGSKPLEEYI